MALKRWRGATPDPSTGTVTRTQTRGHATKDAKCLPPERTLATRDANWLANSNSTSRTPSHNPTPTRTLKNILFRRINVKSSGIKCPSSNFLRYIKHRLPIFEICSPCIWELALATFLSRLPALHNLSILTSNRPRKLMKGYYSIGDKRVYGASRGNV